MEKSLAYKDVYLVPKFSSLRSRSMANLETEFLGRKFTGCWIPSNMKSAIDKKIAYWLSENNYFYIYHRFNDTLNFVKNSQTYFEGDKFFGNPIWNLISISIGVKQEDKELLQKIIDYRLRVDFITIDVAHGHHLLVKEMIEYIKNLSLYPNPFPRPKIIAGNVATPEAVIDLQNWGADAVKIGIAGGAVCSTKNMTGFHVPMFSCVLECAKVAKVPLIADGGIRENGDISKALVSGADMVMIGGILASCIDSPAENIFDPSRSSNLTKPFISHKRFFGSASFRNKGHNQHVEGFELDIPCNQMTYAEKYQEIRESLQSAISYSGGTNLKSFHNTKYIILK